MKVSKSLGTSFLFLMAVCSFFSVLGSQVQAGNQEMIDENVKELDELNKQAVQQIPDLPKDGRVEIKAGVTYKDGSPVFDIFEQHIIKEETVEIPLDQGYTIHSDTQGRPQP